MSLPSSKAATSTASATTMKISPPASIDLVGFSKGGIVLNQVHLNLKLSWILKFILHFSVDLNAFPPSLFQIPSSSFLLNSRKVCRQPIVPQTAIILRHPLILPLFYTAYVIFITWMPVLIALGPILITLRRFYNWADGAMAGVKI